MAGIFPVTITLANSLMSMTGRITAWFFVGSSAGGMVVPWLIGQRFESVGAQVTMLIILIDMSLAAACISSFLPAPAAGAVTCFDHRDLAQAPRMFVDAQCDLRKHDQEGFSMNDTSDPHLRPPCGPYHRR